MSDAPAPRELLVAALGDRGIDRCVAFLRNGQGFLGWASSPPIDLGVGAERLGRARAALEAAHTGAGNARQQVALLALTFDPDEPGSVAVLPTEILRTEDLARSVSVDAHVTDPQGTRAIDRPRYAGSTVRDEEWLEVVSQALDEIEAGAYEKVVLARDLHLWSRRTFPIDRLLGELLDRFPSCTTFVVDGLIGASPEMLIERSGTRIRSRVLAGTASRGGDPDEDARIGAALLASPKDRHEHDLALRSAVEALEPLCRVLDVPQAPSLVLLDNVQHLGSDLVGELEVLDDGGIPHVLELVERLHPTAAVGGAPREPALDAISRLEGMSRGRYAGPVGWFDVTGDGEFAIALRCAEIHGTRARLFAGAGIVAGSLPEAELTETWLKMQAITGVLEG